MKANHASVSSNSASSACQNWGEDSCTRADGYLEARNAARWHISTGVIHGHLASDSIAGHGRAPLEREHPVQVQVTAAPSPADLLGTAGYGAEAERARPGGRYGLQTFDDLPGTGINDRVGGGIEF